MSGRDWIGEVGEILFFVFFFFFVVFFFFFFFFIIGSSESKLTVWSPAYYEVYAFGWIGVVVLLLVVVVGVFVFLGVLGGIGFGGG